MAEYIFFPIKFFLYSIFFEFIVSIFTIKVFHKSTLFLERMAGTNDLLYSKPCVKIAQLQRKRFFWLSYLFHITQVHNKLTFKMERYILQPINFLVLSQMNLKKNKPMKGYDER